MPKTSGRPRSNTAKIAICVIGSVAFFGCSIVVTWFARRAQVAGTLMSNGRGGFMAPVDAYKLAAVLFAFSLVYFWRGWTLTHPKGE